MSDVITDARDAALTGLFDDAAMSSPGRPVLEDALSSHTSLRTGATAWMVNRFLTPVGTLDRLVEQVGQLPRDADPVQLSVLLARAGGGVFGTLAKDLDALSRLMREGPRDGVVEVRMMEGAVLGTKPEVEVEALLTALGEAGVPDDIPLAIEVPFVDRAAGEVVRTVGAVASVGASQGRQLLAKARVAAGATGDLELAGFLLACADSRVRLTFGPGLRHPLRSHDEDLQQGMLNVLAAAVIAYRGGRLAALQSVLAVPGSRVRLGSGAMILDDEVVESEMIAACREDFLTSIACTDVAAAVSDLAAMGSLEESGAKA